MTKSILTDSGWKLLVLWMTVHLRLKIPPVDILLDNLVRYSKHHITYAATNYSTSPKVQLWYQEHIEKAIGKNPCDNPMVSETIFLTNEKTTAVVSTPNAVLAHLHLSRPRFSMYSH